MKNAPEGQREKDDHTTDALRYLMTFMPDLSPDDYQGVSEDHTEYAAAYLDVAHSWRTELQRRNEKSMLGWSVLGQNGSEFTGIE